MSQDRPSRRQSILKQFWAWFPLLLPIGLIIGAAVTALVLNWAESKSLKVYFFDEIITDPDRPCVIRVTTWIDQNRNGERDPEDILLPGVRVSFDGHEQITAASGSAEFEFASGRSCLRPQGTGLSVPTMRVSAQPPAGYRLTTPADFTVTESSTVAKFGFTYLPGVPTVTPTPASQP